LAHCADTRFCEAGSALMFVVSLLAFTACSAAPRGASEENWMEYLETVRLLEAQGETIEAGSDDERRAIERFRSALSDFKAPDFAERIREVYAEDAFFNDTLKTLRGADEIEEYLMATADAVEKGTVEFLDLVSDGGNHYFRWAMTIRFKRFARGEDTKSVGMTHVRFDSEGKVVLHQDFWDSTGGLFEHVPALGWMLRRAKNRL
jgi:hypothetical protein